jgi:ferredoxin like protein
MMRQRKHNDLTAEQEASIPRVNVDDMLATLKYYVDEEYTHLSIKDQDACCQCQGQPCLYFCPMGVYRQDEQGKIIVGYQACVECGSCRVACPSENIVWALPRGGYGVAYKFG